MVWLSTWFWCWCRLWRPLCCLLFLGCLLFQLCPSTLQPRFSLALVPKLTDGWLVILSDIYFHFGTELYTMFIKDGKKCKANLMRVPWLHLRTAPYGSAISGFIPLLVFLGLLVPLGLGLIIHLLPQLSGNFGNICHSSTGVRLLDILTLRLK